MQAVTEIALEKSPRGVFTRREAACWLDARGARLDGLLKRAVGQDEVWRLRREVFLLNPRYLHRPPDPFALAQFIHGPSYISMETALAWHEWIPEAVYAVTSATLSRSRSFETPLGVFTFTRVPQDTLYVEVQRRETDGGTAFMAEPLKALADYVHAHRCRWTQARPAIESLRLEEAALDSIGSAAFDRLLENYPAGNARRFLEGFRKDLKR